jgi:hypothetical protein
VRRNELAQGQFCELRTDHQSPVRFSASQPQEFLVVWSLFVSQSRQSHFRLCEISHTAMICPVHSKPPPDHDVLSSRKHKRHRRRACEDPDTRAMSQCQPPPPTLDLYQLNVRIVRRHAQPAVSVWEDFVKTISSRWQRKKPPKFRTCVRVGQEARLS